MHLGNGIICPVTGIPMLMIAGATAVYAFKKARKDFSKDKNFYTVALTSLVFALQMINFSIPQTGSSGHIIGGILLAILLGPYAAFLAMCSILLVQSLLFADGSIMALGCNIINMGAIACFVAYPLLYKPFEKMNKPFLGAFLASVVALQLGSIFVVLEGALSGSIAASSILKFTGLMQAIHLPIGIVEGILTGFAIVAAKNFDYKKLSISYSFLGLILAGVISQYASQKPDGLEWSLLNIQNSIIPQVQGNLYALSQAVQNKTAILANFATIPANILGFLIISFMMYIICTTLTLQKGKNVNER